MTFEDIVPNTPFVKIIYNGEIIFDDIDGDETLERRSQMFVEYGDRLIHEMHLIEVYHHHCILEIQGE